MGLCDILHTHPPYPPEVISVCKSADLLLTSFNAHVAMTTLHTAKFPVSEHYLDLNPIDNAHAEHTKNVFLTLLQIIYDDISQLDIITITEKKPTVEKQNNIGRLKFDKEKVQI